MYILKLLPFPIFVVIIMVQFFTLYQNKLIFKDLIMSKRVLCKKITLALVLIICLFSCFILLQLKETTWTIKVFLAALAYLTYAIGYFIEHEIIKYPNDKNRWKETIKENARLLPYFLPFYFFMLATCTKVDFLSFHGCIDFVKNGLVYLFKYWYLTTITIGLILTISYKARAKRYV